MHRIRLNATIRYLRIPTYERSTEKIRVTDENDDRLSSCKPCEPCSTDELEWLTEATMPNDTQNAIIVGEPAYLIYREVNANGNKSELEPLRNEEIIRLESNGGYCYIYLKDNTRYLLAMSLKWVSKYLHDFVRIHRTHAVNPIYVKQYLLDHQKRQKDRYLLLKTDEKLPWSRRHLRERRQDSPQLFDLIL